MKSSLSVNKVHKNEIDNKQHCQKHVSRVLKQAMLTEETQI